MLLVAFTMICTPILEKKLLEERKARYLLLKGQTEIAPAEILAEVPTETLTETPTETLTETPAPTSRFAGFKPTKTFYERLSLSGERMQNRYRLVLDTLLRIENVRFIEGKTQHTYKWKSHCVARLFFKGKTLHVGLGLDPKEYENRYLLPFGPLQTALEKCRDRGLAAKTYDGRWHLTPNGFLVSNSIISDLLLIQEKTQSFNR